MGTLIKKLSGIWSFDGLQIELNKEQDVRYWTETLHCTPQELELAVEAVGPSINAVRTRLSNRMV